MNDASESFMLQEIPLTWTWCRLPQLGELNRGKSRHRPRNDPSLFGGAYPFVQTGDVRSADRFITKAMQHYSEFGLAQSRLWPPGTVCITIAANIAETAILAIPACFPDSVVGFLADERVADGSYVELFIRTARESLERFAPATAQKNINLDVLSNVYVPVPPLPEQRRIVAKLDALDASSKRARADLDRIPALVARAKQAILAKLFEAEALGGLHRLCEVCLSISDGDHQAPPKADTGIPFITISAMNDGRLALSKASRFVPENYFTSLKPIRRAKRGDVLFSVTGSIGIPALVDTDAPFVFQRHIAVLKVDRNVLFERYLTLILAAPQIRTQAENVATGTAQLTIPLNGLRAFKIPVPSIAAQMEIVRRIEAAFQKIDRMAAEAASASKLLDRLDQALLAKAFRGELVPQNPEDEPAAKLPERIKTSSAAEPQKRTRGRKAGAKA